MNSLFRRARRPLRMRDSWFSNTAMLRAASKPITSATKRVCTLSMWARSSLPDSAEAT